MIPVSIAWSIIMLHGIIPHNHSNICTHKKHEAPGSGSSITFCNTTLISDVATEDEESVCHFNTNLFHQDYPTYYPVQCSMFDPEIIHHQPTIIITEAGHSINGPPPVISGYSFRAPPVVV